MNRFCVCEPWFECQKFKAKFGPKISRNLHLFKNVQNVWKSGKFIQNENLSSNTHHQKLKYICFNMTYCMFLYSPLQKRLCQKMVSDIMRHPVQCLSHIDMYECFLLTAGLWWFGGLCLRATLSVLHCKTIPR